MSTMQHRDCVLHFSFDADSSAGALFSLSHYPNIALERRKIEALIEFLFDEPVPDCYNGTAFPSTISSSGARCAVTAVSINASPVANA